MKALRWKLYALGMVAGIVVALVMLYQRTGMM